MKNRSLSFVVVLSLFLATTVTAQQNARQLDRADAESECSGSNCQTNFFLEVNELRFLDLPEEEFNARLGQIASNLFRHAKEAESKSVSRPVSAALVQLARISTDEQQRESLIFISRVLRDGDADLFEIDDPFAVSPS